MQMIGALLLAVTATGSGDAVLVEFSSAGCAPCRAMQPVVSTLEREGHPIRHVDVDREPSVAQRYRIERLPTYVVVVGGRERFRIEGVQPIEVLRSALQDDPHSRLQTTGATAAPPDPTATGGVPQTRLAPVAPVNATAGESMPSMSLAEAVQRAEAATVRLRVHDGDGFGVGTGTIIDTHGDEALVLTCGHVFRSTQGKGKVEVDLFHGGQVVTVPGQVIDYDADSRDIGLVSVRPGFPVQPVPVLSSQERPRSGASVFSYGCDRGADPSRRDTRVTAIDKYNQHLGVSNLEIAGAPVDGRSGGGLFDEQGRLIGVCNAADYEDDIGIYAGPGNIYWQLDRVDLAQLYRGGRGVADSGVRLAQAGSDAPTAGAPITPASLATPAATATPAALGLTAGGAGSGAAAGGQEVIVILRDRGAPSGAAQVMTFDSPPDELMRLLQAPR